MFIENLLNHRNVAGICNNMKISFSTGLFLLLMWGVFGAETEEVKTVSLPVMEGDSVTLNPDLTHIWGINKIVWRFGVEGLIIADSSNDDSWLSDTDERFRDRLQLNKTTGSLTIKNMRTEHSGLYQLHIDHNDRTSFKSFTVTVLESGLSSGATAGICVTLLLIAAAGAAVAFYYRHRICDPKRLMAEEKMVLGTEGRSVDLETDTELQRGDEIKWWFEDLILIEFRKETSKKDDTDQDYIECDVADGRFRSELVLNTKTGDLLINNIRTFHSGLYKLQISRRNRRTEYMRFTVTVTGVLDADAEEVKSVSVMEGDSVTLNPDLSQIQGFIEILWRFGEKGSTIAQTDGNDILYADGKRFRDRLQLDQTGSLNITNVRTNHSGLYKAEINHKTETSYQKFSVTVYESPSVIDGGETELKSVSVTEGDPVTLHVPQIQGDELIVWRFGDEGKLIAKADIEAKSSSLYDETDERFRDRLKLDQTGSLTITNTRTTDSGEYKVKISSNKQTLYKRFTVTVSEPGLSGGVVAGIIVGVGVLLVTAAVGAFFYRRKKTELHNQKSKISETLNETSVISGKLKLMSEISTQLKQMTEDCEKELSEISEHHQTLKISENLKEMLDISEQLKQMSKDCEKKLSQISERLKQMSLTKKGETSEQETPLKDVREPFVHAVGTDVTKEDATRSEMEKDEREKFILVEDTALSQAIGGPPDADGIVRDRQGKSLVLRNTGTEHTAVLSI